MKYKLFLILAKIRGLVFILLGIKIDIKYYYFALKDNSEAISFFKMGAIPYLVYKETMIFYHKDFLIGKEF